MTTQVDYTKLQLYHLDALLRLTQLDSRRGAEKYGGFIEQAFRKAVLFYVNDCLAIGLPPDVIRDKVLNYKPTTHNEGAEIVLRYLSRRTFSSTSDEGKNLENRPWK